MAELRHRFRGPALRRNEAGEARIPDGLSKWRVVAQPQGSHGAHRPPGVGEIRAPTGRRLVGSAGPSEPRPLSKHLGAPARELRPPAEAQSPADIYYSFTTHFSCTSLYS